MSHMESLEYHLHQKEEKVKELLQEISILKEREKKKQAYYDSLLELLDEICFVLGYASTRLKEYDESLPEKCSAVLNAAKERIRQERG